MRSVSPRILILLSLTALAVPAATGAPAGAIPTPDTATHAATLPVAETEPTGSVPVSSPNPVPVEVIEKRTATSRTFLLPDGSYQSEVYPAPVHYRAPSGEWEPIDNTLVPTQRDRFVAENAANDYRLLIPQDAGAAPVRVEAAGAWVSFAASGVDGAPSVQGSEATISGGLGPNTRLEYQALNQGVKETIVLSAPPAQPPSYVFDLHASPGLTPRLTPTGGVEFRDTAGAVVFAVPAPFMTDASGGDAGYSTDVAFDLAPTADGWRLTLTPDATWLADPARVWPVVVDPSVTIFGQPRDTWLDQSAPANAHVGGDRIRAGWTNGNARRALVRFNLDGIPANATVSSAALSLFIDPDLTLGTDPAEYVVRRVTQSWTEDATWNRYDGTNTWGSPGGDFVTSAVGGPNLAGDTPQYRSFDVPFAGGWVSGANPNNGLIVKQIREDVANVIAFYSANDPNDNRWPKLEVTYTEPAPPVFDKIGDRRFFTFEEQALNDRLSLKVNVANGNLLLAATDLTIAGTGLDASVQRFYNSLSTSPDPSGLSPGWVMGDAPTVRLELNQAEPGRVVFVGPSGYRVRFDRNASGGFVRAEPGLDAKLTLDEGAGEYTLEWFSKTKYIFNAATGRMTRQEDKQGNTINYTYDANGNLDFLTDTHGRRIDFTYSGGLLESVTDVAGGRTYDYTYGGGRLVSSAVISYTEGTDTSGNLGALTTYGYDASGRLNLITDPKGNMTKIEYVGPTGRVSKIRRLGLVEETDAQDPTTIFTYPASEARCPTPANVVVVNGPRLASDVADTTTYCHDGDDRVVKTIDANGHERSTEYTTNSNVITFNESGVASGPAFGYSYSNNDNLTKVTLPQTGAQAPGTATAAYGDPVNPHFPTSVRDFATSKASADPATWDYDYDDKGNLIKASHTGTPDIAFFYCYDGKGQLQRIDPPPQDTTGLDEDTNAGCGTANQGNDTLFTYFPNGDLQKVDPPGTHGTQTFTYDALSRIRTMTDGRGVMTTYSYDALDHITQLDFTGPAGIPGVTRVTYGYDTNGNMTARQDDTGNSNFSFDDLNLMFKEDPEAPQATITYTYDLARNLTSVESTDETGPVTYSYDKLNRVTSAIDQKGRETTFGYNAKDQRTRTTYPHIVGANSAIMKNVYDDARRLVCTYTYSGTEPALGSDGCPTDRTAALMDVEYTYTDPSTGLDTTTRYSEANQANRTTTYDYDNIGRLNSAVTKNTSGTVLRSYVYTLGKRGNVTQEDVTGTLVPNQTTTFAYNDANEMCWSAPGTPASDCATTPSGATTYTFDAAGNLAASSAGLSAGYNLQGQTAAVTPPGGQLFKMKYADVTSDRRVEVGDTRMGYNQLGLSAQAIGSSGVPHTDWFVRDPSGTLISQIDRDDPNDNTRDRWYIFDGLGSVIGLVNNQGQVTKTYTYEPYGEEINPDPVDPNPWRYAAGYFDKATGMLKFGTRYYMSSLMRWTQMDPLAGNPADPMSLNAYSYVGGDPVNYTDVSGRDWWNPFDDWSTEDWILAAAGVAFTAGILLSGLGGIAAVIELSSGTEVFGTIAGVAAVDFLALTGIGVGTLGLLGGATYAIATYDY